MTFFTSPSASANECRRFAAQFVAERLLAPIIKLHT
jgi:hypothetical protein